MGYCIVAGGKPDMAAPVSKKVFANNTWEEIIAACQTKTVPDTWLVGDQKAMTINGTDYLIDIIGKNHDDYADGSGKAPLTFQMHNLYNESRTMNADATNVGGWTSCLMRSTHLPEILNLMPYEVRTSVKEVVKKTSAGNKSSTINTTNDKLFLLSEIEVVGSSNAHIIGEGSQYEYYMAGNPRIKEPLGLFYFWFLRSPCITTDVGFYAVHDDGSITNPGAQNSLGVSFAFCF